MARLRILTILTLAAGLLTAGPAYAEFRSATHEDPADDATFADHGEGGGPAAQLLDVRSVYASYDSVAGSLYVTFGGTLANQYHRATRYRLTFGEPAADGTCGADATTGFEVTAVGSGRGAGTPTVSASGPEGFDGLVWTDPAAENGIGVHVQGEALKGRDFGCVTGITVTTEDAAFSTSSVDEVGAFCLLGDACFATPLPIAAPASPGPA